MEKLNPSNFAFELRAIALKLCCPIRQMEVAGSLADLTTPAKFWVTYGNCLTFIEGYVLKQAALLERMQMQAKPSNDRAQPGAAEVRFCAFLAQAKWVD